MVLPFYSTVPAEGTIGSLPTGHIVLMRSACSACAPEWCCCTIPKLTGVTRQRHAISVAGFIENLLVPKAQWYWLPGVGVRDETSIPAPSSTGCEQQTKPLAGIKHRNNEY